MDYYNRANELKEDTIEIRRYLHKNAEVGLDLPNTYLTEILSHKFRVYVDME